MTDFTPEQLEAVREALYSKGVSINDASLIIAELQPKPKFAEGQVRAVNYNGDKWVFTNRGSVSNPKLVRHLTPTELGPAVNDLREAMAALTLRGGSIPPNYGKDIEDLHRFAEEALAAFDATHGEE